MSLHFNVQWQLIETLTTGRRQLGRGAKHSTPPATCHNKPGLMGKIASLTTKVGDLEKASLLTKLRSAAPHDHQQHLHALPPPLRRHPSTAGARNSPRRRQRLLPNPDQLLIPPLPRGTGLTSSPRMAPEQQHPQDKCLEEITHNATTASPITNFVEHSEPDQIILKRFLLPFEFLNWSGFYPSFAKSLTKVPKATTTTTERVFERKRP